MSCNMNLITYDALGNGIVAFAVNQHSRRVRVTEICERHTDPLAICVSSS